MAPINREDTPDIRRKVTLRTDRATAFAVYVERPWEWLPPEHRFLHDAVQILIEARTGGRFLERGRDGSEMTRGTVLACDPPNRIVLTWRVGPGWRPLLDDEHAARIVVEFREVGGDATEVSFTYTELERTGELAPQLRAAISTDQPGDTLHRYADLVARLER